MLHSHRHLSPGPLSVTFCAMQRQAFIVPQVDPKPVLNHNGALAMRLIVFTSFATHLRHRSDSEDIDGTETNHTI
jgi:hypothetical protein